MSTHTGPKPEFRTALGAFATGVTIVTTVDAAGEPIGVTASSFNSVSLDPPLILWSLAKTSLSRDAFCAGGHFAVHVLAETQEDISNRFARSGADKFADLGWIQGALGSPVLEDFAALFQCRTRHQYEGGDHIILVGEVVAFEARDHAPLLFHGGRYAERRPRPAPDDIDTVDLDRARFTDDFLFYLLARAYFQTSRPAREQMRHLGLDQQEHSTLAALTMQAPATAQEIARMLEHTGNAPSCKKLDAMCSRGLLALERDTYVLGVLGREKLIQILSVSKAFESDIADQMSRGELAEAKRLLRRIIDLTGKEVPLDWRS